MQQLICSIAVDVNHRSVCLLPLALTFCVRRPVPNRIIDPARMISREQFVERAISNPTEQHLSLVVFVTFVLFAVVRLLPICRPLPFLHVPEADDLTLLNCIRSSYTNSICGSIP